MRSENRMSQSSVAATKTRALIPGTANLRTFPVVQRTKI